MAYNEYGVDALDLHLTSLQRVVAHVAHHAEEDLHGGAADVRFEGQQRG